MGVRVRGVDVVWVCLRGSGEGEDGGEEGICGYVRVMEGGEGGKGGGECYP